MDTTNDMAEGDEPDAGQDAQGRWSTASSPGRASPTGSGRSACSSCCSPGCRSSTRIRRSISATSPASSSTTTCWRSAPKTPRTGRAASPGSSAPSSTPPACSACPGRRNGRATWLSRAGRPSRPTTTSRPAASSTSSSPGCWSARCSPGWSPASSTAISGATSCRRVDDLRRLPRDIADHARLRFHHTRDYNTLQKLTYADRAVHPLPADDPDRAGDVALAATRCCRSCPTCSADGRRRAPSISSSWCCWSPSSSSTS